MSKNVINIYLDCETIDLPDRLDLSNEDLSKYGYKSNDEVDILLSLSLIIETNGKTFVYDNLCKPKYKIAPSASSTHGIGNDMVGLEPNSDNIIVELPQSHEIESYRKLKEILDNKDVTINIIGHNINFDKDVLKRIKDENGQRLTFGSNVNFIDTLKVSKHLYNSEKYNKSSDYPEHYSLSYLTYYTKAYKDIRNIQKAMWSRKKLFKFHDSLSDCYINRSLVKYYIDNFNLDITDLLELTNKPVKLKIMPFGYERVRGIPFDQISISDLKYISENYDDEDVIYTCNQYLKQYGIKNSSNILNFGKFKNLTVDDSSIPDDYLLWAHNEYNNLSDSLRKSIREELEKRGIDNPYRIITFNREFKGKTIDDKNVPNSIIEDGIKKVNSEEFRQELLNELNNRKNHIENEKNVTTIDDIDFDDFFDSL